ncbi:A/G-specific adenine glycosylase [Candidatus Wolfebacteria bacterium]|nr:A/G-specific adenine glycosylase [Candidatus Wolfebacteria bacterium]
MEQKKFKKTVWDFYKKDGRSFPWRNTKNPYHIWVSEIMLQQTQVARVIPRYSSFLKEFKTIKSLADASLSEVLKEWQGLGYNRRAKYLHEGAKYILLKYKGIFPKENMQCVPGIGPYTEAAIQAFAFNKGIPCIETNIRTVFTHHFFKNKKNVHDKEILRLIEETLDTKNPREWYWALMDYGAALKSSGVQINNKSRHYIKQSVFKGSDREVRGTIIRTLTEQKSLENLFPTRRKQFNIQLQKLCLEGFVEKKKGKYKLVS